MRFNEKFPKLFGFVFLLVASLLLQACGATTGNLLSAVQSDSKTLALDTIATGKGINIGYTVGKAANVSVALESDNGTRYELRKDEPRSPGRYSLRLDGFAETQENGLIQRKLLANGTYRYVITAKNGEEVATQTGDFSVSGNKSPGVPKVEGLTANPTVISPNQDAIDDVAILNWRTSQPATVTISISGKDLPYQVLKTLKNQPAQEDKVNFDGRDLQGKPLPDGVYTYTVQAVNAFGETTRQSSTVQIKGGGIPRVQVTSINIAPTEIIWGNLVTVTVKVKNTGTVPVRSRGPYSGYTYNSREVYSSIQNGIFDEAAGYWRIGVDFDANGGGGAVRYPWRWGFGKEYLQPGEEVEIVGSIKLERPEEKINLYVGLIQEKISLQDRLRITPIKISY
jgi:FlgD Ig-like domain